MTVKPDGTKPHVWCGLLMLSFIQRADIINDGQWPLKDSVLFPDRGTESILDHKWVKHSEEQDKAFKETLQEEQADKKDQYEEFLLKRYKWLQKAMRTFLWEHKQKLMCPEKRVKALSSEVHGDTGFAGDGICKGKVHDHSSHGGAKHDKVTVSFPLYGPLPRLATLAVFLPSCEETGIDPETTIRSLRTTIRSLRSIMSLHIT